MTCKSTHISVKTINCLLTLASRADPHFVEVANFLFDTGIASLELAAVN